MHINATTILAGVSLGFVGFAILLFWVKLIFKDFDEDSKFFWPLFWINMLVWIVGTCVISRDLLDNPIFGLFFMLFFFGSLIIMAIMRFIGKI